MKKGLLLILCALFALGTFAQDFNLKLTLDEINGEPVELQSVDFTISLTESGKYITKTTKTSKKRFFVGNTESEVFKVEDNEYNMFTDYCYDVDEELYHTFIEFFPNNGVGVIRFIEIVKDKDHKAVARYQYQAISLPSD